MAGFLPIAVVISLLAAGATADGYHGSIPSPSTPPPHTPPPAAPYTPPHATPPPAALYTPPHAHGGGDGDKKKKLVVVRVEGLVLCQSCAKRTSASLEGAAPLQGARVTVTCRDRKNRVMAWRTPAADYNGYFHAEFGVERAGDFFGEDPREACFVRLLSSPDAKCNVVTNINGGMGGARLRHEGKRWTDGRGIENVVYAAGPLSFKPERCAPTHHY